MTVAVADDGFSIAELLVALAITSFIALAIGGLLTAGLRANEHVDENAAIQSALVDLQGLAALAASEVGFALSEVGERGFALVRQRSMEPPVTWTVGLRSEHGETAIELWREKRRSAASLAAFDAASLEYLTQDMGGDPSWVAASRGLRTALAVRLKLERGRRVWRPLVWMAASPTAGTP
jgi:hypothetical protein